MLFGLKIWTNDIDEVATQVVCRCTITCRKRFGNTSPALYADVVFVD